MSRYRPELAGWSAQLLSIEDDPSPSNDAPFEHTKGLLRIMPALGLEKIYWKKSWISTLAHFRCYRKNLSQTLLKVGVKGYIIWSGSLYERVSNLGTENAKLESCCYLADVMPDPHEGTKDPRSALILSSNDKLYSLLANTRFSNMCPSCGTKKLFVSGEEKRFCPSCRC